MPQFDSEVCRTRNESGVVVGVPVHVLDGQGVSAVGHEVSSSVGLRALVDGSLFGSDQEFAVALLRAEVEAGCSSIAGDCGVVIFCFVLV